MAVDVCGREHVCGHGEQELHHVHDECWQRQCVCDLWCAAGFLTVRDQDAWRDV